MNYELAKKLKEAGFPFITTSSGKIWIGEDWLSPTLSELIGACGEEIYSIRRTRGKDGWVAHGYNIPNTDIDQIHLQVLGQKGFIGSTPEEAVANLWLKLNTCEHCNGTGKVPVLILDTGDNMPPGGAWVESGEYKDCICKINQ